MRFDAVDRYYSAVLGGAVGSLRPGEIAVVRSDSRSEEHDGISVPVWILVSVGRSIASTSRFLKRVLEAWAEEFAAPEFLLREDSLGDLRSEVERSLDADVEIVLSRIFVPRDAAAWNGRNAKMMDVPADEGFVARAVRAAVAEGKIPILRVRVSDRRSARAALDAGWVEYGRSARLLARRRCG